MGSIATEDRGPVRILRLQHGKANALDIELCEALVQALDEAHPAGALVITGTGSIFSAGVDLVRVVDGGAAYLGQFLPLLRDAFRRLAMVEKPVVAAVNGHAIAGGFILLAAADRAVASAGPGRLGTTELLVGVPFPEIALQLLRLRAGARAAELAYLGQTYDVGVALELGLVDEVSEAALDRAVQLAEAMAATGAAFAITKRQLRRPLSDALEAYAEEHDLVVDATWLSRPALERVEAYVDSVIRKR